MEVRYLSAVEQEELLAAKDAVGDPSPDTPPPGLEESGACTPLPVPEQDF